LVDAGIGVLPDHVRIDGPARWTDAHLDIVERAATLAQHRFEGTHTLGRLLRAEIEAIPALPEVGDAPQGRIRFAAKVDWRVRLLDGLRVLSDRRQRVVRAVVLRHGILPERL